MKLHYIKNVPLYYWLLVTAFLIHVAFEIMFLYVGNSFMATYNIISILIFGMGVAIIHKNQTWAVFMCFVEATVFVALATIVMGWDYGFQNWYYAFIVLSITVPFKNRKPFYILGIIQVIIYITPYFLVFRANRVVSENCIFVILNMIFVFGMIFFAEYALNISKAMEVIFLQKEVQEMEAKVKIDALTGLTTRRQMNEILSRLSAKENTQYALIFADIDNFKEVNDSYGHEVGDLVLVNAAKNLTKEIRGDDVVARWGGDEFLILLENKKYPEERVTPEIIREILNRVQQRMAGEPIEYKSEKIHITMTFGGVVSDGYSDIAEMIRNADKQMYRGKKTGKNTIMIEMDRE